MYNWRVAIGLVCPKDNMVVEPEFYRLATDGVTAHSTRLHTADLDEMPEAAKQEVRVLEEMGADVVGYACNASTFHGGPDAHARIRDRLAGQVDTPVTTASGAVLAALDALSVSEVAVVTPYGERDQERLAAFLGGNGVTPTTMTGLGLDADDLTDLTAVNEQTARDTYRRVVDTDLREAEAVLVVSTNLASVETIDAMEASLGRPVVTVNQALYWQSLRAAGVDPRVPGYGRLLSGPR